MNWIVWVGLRGDALDLKHIDDGQEADKEQKEKDKKADRSNEESDIDPSGGEVAPRGWKKVPMDGGDDDNETLEPHSGVREHDDG